MIAIASSTITLAAILIAHPRPVQDTAPIDWVATCSPTTGLSRITFHSLSGDVHEDDMQVRIVWENEKATLAQMHQAWFKASSFISNVSTKCTGIGAFELPGARLLLWIRYDGRPGFDHLAVLLIDPTRQAVLDVVQDFGEVAGANATPMVLGRAGRFEALVTREWLLDRIGGGEFARPEWKVLTIAGTKLHSQWRR